MYSTRFWLDNERDTNTKPHTIKPAHHQATSNHLLELQKEIKEEEEEIFADINSLIDSRSNLFSAFEHDENNTSQARGWDDGENLPTTFNHHFRGPSNYANNNNSPGAIKANTHISTSCDRNNDSHMRDLHNSVSDEPPYTNDTSEDLNEYQSHSVEDTTITTTTQDYHNESGRITISSTDDQASHHNLQAAADLQVVDNDEDSDPFAHDFVSHQHHVSQHKTTLHTANGLSMFIEQGDEIFDDQHHQSTNHSNPMLDSDHGNETDFIEEQYVVDDSPAGNQGYQALQTALQVTNNLPKPCIFFLEGNCRRSDCKYSHDLSNITCKYWIEGFCFKGELCPFLHSYNPPSESSLYDDDAIKRLSGKELNPTFVIESEADFPSLPQDAPTTALNDSTRSSINADAISTNIKNQILSSNPAVVFKIVKKKRKRG